MKEGKLIFGKILDKDDWTALGKFRLQNYAHKKPYMLNEINEYGIDEKDHYSNIYIARLDHKIIASIRLCPFPFEANQLLSEKILQSYLGNKYQEKYLEWSRLLIDRHHTMPGLLRALITYAGVMTIKQKKYPQYFGYSTPQVKRLFSKFALANKSIKFTIPKRGNHTYSLFKGDFYLDFINLLKENKKE